MGRISLADPNHRKESYHARPASSSADQEGRRRTALEAQKQRRTHAIEAARSSFQSLNFMEDLSLDGASDDSDSDAVPLHLPATPASPPLDGTGSPLPAISKEKRKRFKPKYHAWAKNLLCQPEMLDLRHSLPEELETDWRAVVCPKGKRCLIATSTDSLNGNTILYSRVAGRTLARLKTVLPPDCLLDAVWDSSLSVLWILDVPKWRGQYLVSCEAEMRAFFISSKLSELETQPYLPPNPSFSPSVSPASRPTLVLPVPSYTPLTPSTLLPLLSSLSSPSAMPAAVFAPSPPSPSSPSPANPPFSLQTTSIPFTPDGLLLYLAAAHYESGSTPLVGWVPVEVKDAELRDKEGVGRMRELVEAWERRGGPAAVANGGEEVQMDGQ
ncbi:hypothetical protein JCM8547_000269 [Rhodosporidiobolus lusitaniae]